MLHKIKSDGIGPHGPEMVRAVEACVHCGFCLPTCPTYSTLGEEMDSPRGRIVLMKEALEGTLTDEDVRPYIDRCLGCVSCVTACPSGVRYGELLTGYRAGAESRASRPWRERLRRALILQTLPYPGRFRLALRSAMPTRRWRRFFPSWLRPMIELLPDRMPPAVRLPSFVPAHGQRRARVALVAGCAQQVLAPRINEATIQVLRLNGVEVVIPPSQGCCGSLALHVGSDRAARAAAEKNLRAFPKDVDAVITNASGCGSGIREYPALFKDTANQDRGREFASRAIDVCAFLDDLGFVPPAGPPVSRRVAYHDACHLAHAQQIRKAPRRLLRSIPGIELVEPAEWELCCGSAGIYNMEQPEIAGRLGERKAENLLALHPDIIASGNIGCLTQIAHHLRNGDSKPRICHTVEVLAEAYADEE